MSHSEKSPPVRHGEANRKPAADSAKKPWLFNQLGLSDPELALDRLSVLGTVESHVRAVGAAQRSGENGVEGEGTWHHSLTTRSERLPPASSN